MQIPWCKIDRRQKCSCVNKEEDYPALTGGLQTLVGVCDGQLRPPASSLRKTVQTLYSVVDYQTIHECN